MARTMPAIRAPRTMAATTRRRTRWVAAQFLEAGEQLAAQEEAGQQLAGCPGRQGLGSHPLAHAGHPCPVVALPGHMAAALTSHLPARVRTERCRPGAWTPPRRWSADARPCAHLPGPRSSNNSSSRSSSSSRQKCREVSVTPTVRPCLALLAARALLPLSLPPCLALLAARALLLPPPLADQGSLPPAS